MSWHVSAVDRSGGNATSPIRSILPSICCISVWIPDLTLLRSGQFGGVLLTHIDPVRSTTTTISNGVEEHGEHAEPETVKLNLSIPTILAKLVETLADSLIV